MKFFKNKDFASQEHQLFQRVGTHAPFAQQKLFS
jgi:hypothetical protein